MALKYQRILLKISGEALGGEKGICLISKRAYAFTRLT